MMHAESERCQHAATLSQAIVSVNGKLAQIGCSIWRWPLVDLLKALLGGGRFGLRRFLQRRQVDARQANFRGTDHAHHNPEGMLPFLKGQIDAHAIHTVRQKTAPISGNRR